MADAGAGPGSENEPEGTVFFGSGPRFEQQRHLIDRVAASDSTVLIRGETGTGKEVVASFIHRNSPRARQPFVVVDCGALQDNLLQSELFGHEQGAYTGATRSSHGLFEVANHGTVFLDEIGEVSSVVQAGLLRVLESARFRRLGSAKEVHVDVRLIAATNRDLEGLMEAGRFRRDLYFRLNTVQLELPPLRQRQDELPGFIGFFLSGENSKRGTQRKMSPQALAILCNYGWPGNVRQLRHVLERAMVVAEGDSIEVDHLGPDLLTGGAPTSADPSGLATLAQVEHRHIALVLAACGGHRAIAARILGISERNLYRKLSGQPDEPPK